MSKRVAILQSSYLPWKGYFDIIHDVDEFIFLDEAQYTTRDWRTRNRIKTPQGSAWLTIPVGGHRNRRICDVELPADWTTAHRRRLLDCYARAPHFDTYWPFLEEAFERTWRFLSEMNQFLVRTISREILGIRTQFRDSREFVRRGRGEEWILDLLDQMNADVYISGPTAKSYIDSDRFAARGIELVWKTYDGYPEYPQFHPPFVHQLTILDLLFHTGPDAAWYIWGWRSNPR